MPAEDPPTPAEAPPDEAPPDDEAPPTAERPVFAQGTSWTQAVAMFEANVARTREALRQREALLDELEEAAEDAEEDAFSDADPEVYTLACAACERQLSRRAQSVSLVAEAATKLYSTDIPSADIREVAGERTIDTCECRICSVQCGACDAVCGYHVVRPCSPCGQSEHNGHFWLFHAENVVGTQRLDAEDEPMRWSALPYNGVEEAPAEEADLCPVCAAPIMERTRVLAACRHEFCFGCISREVDARGRCPLDRLRLERSMLERIDT